MKTAIGLMSGTSMDGIDVAMVSSDGESRVVCGPSLAVDYSPAERGLLEQALQDALHIKNRNERPGCLDEAETLITARHIDAVHRFLDDNDMRPVDVDLIGFHGQTVLHRPNDRLTVQIGDGARLARETGIDTVFDMRAADIAAGGQGAPLVPVFHQALAQQVACDGAICFVNIGGISNVTYLRGNDAPLAFDCGPGNALIDQWVQASGGVPFDPAGAIASEGRIVSAILERYMATPFFSEKLPKSLDRFDFPPLPSGETDLFDGARTLARLTAQSIMASIDHFPEAPEKWIISGGGRLNNTIMADLRELTAPLEAQVLTAEDASLDGDMMEAQAFGYLAIRSQMNLPLTFPTTTGCPNAMTGGVYASANPSDVN